MDEKNQISEKIGQNSKEKFIFLSNNRCENRSKSAASSVENRPIFGVNWGKQGPILREN